MIEIADRDGATSLTTISTTDRQGRWAVYVPLTRGGKSG